MSRVIGCLSTAIFDPVCGSSGFGAVMSTPGIGPATVGLRGFELFVDSHPVATSATHARTTTAYAGLLCITTHWCPNSLSERTGQKFSGQAGDRGPRFRIESASWEARSLARP